MNDVVRTPDEVLEAIQKPELRTIGKLTLNPEDCFVLCGGFEDRSVAALESSAGVGFKVVLVTYEPFIADNKADYIREICRKRRLNKIELSYNRQDPAGFGDRLVDEVSGCAGRVFWDISGMSRLLIVQAIVALRSVPRVLRRSFLVYAEAQKYSPSQQEAIEELTRSQAYPSFPIFFLSSGVFEITLLPELSSNAPPGLQTRLVAFPSLDAHQLLALRAELQPSRLSIIEGVPPGPHNQWRERAIAQVNGLDQIANIEKYRVSTLNYQETLSCLLMLYREHGIYERFLVSPTGSKMQAVAVGLLRLCLEDIQIVYPTPRDFLKPERYTEGVKDIYILDLDEYSQAIAFQDA